jgi:hypothetical protein
MSDAEIPEADALEQKQSVMDPARVTHPKPEPTIDAEVPEADALEQAQEVPITHDEDR